MNNKLSLCWLLTIIILLLGACAPAEVPSTSGALETSAPTTIPVPEAVQNAVDQLAKELNLDAKNITIQTIEIKNWPDACLGLPAADEVCAAVITSGFRVVLAVGGSSYEFHTDREGLVIRQVPTGQGDELNNLAAERLAELAGLPLESIRMIGRENVEWPDGCLGAPQPDEACPEMIVSGYKFEFAVQNRDYILHTNHAVSDVRLGGPQETIVIVKVRQQAAQDRGVQLTEVELISSEVVQWRDSCLGIQRQGMMCLMVITPGYRVIVKAGSTTLEYHTNRTASAIAFYKP